MANRDISHIALVTRLLSAFEFWDKDCVHVVSEKMLTGVQFPLASDKPYEFYALLETQGSRREHDEAVGVTQTIQLVIMN